MNYHFNESEGLENDFGYEILGCINFKENQDLCQLKCLLRSIKRNQILFNPRFEINFGIHVLCHEYDHFRMTLTKEKWSEKEDICVRY